MQMREEETRRERIRHHALATPFGTGFVAHADSRVRKDSQHFALRTFRRATCPLPLAMLASGKLSKYSQVASQVAQLHLEGENHI
jgi:hypothetical protein